jgi:hypothetical protein
MVGAGRPKGGSPAQRRPGYSECLRPEVTVAYIILVIIALALVGGLAAVRRRRA